MRVPIVLVLVLAILVGSGVASPAPAAGADEDDVGPRNLRCYGNTLPGEPPAIPILENHFDLGLRCWGHIGTHTYFVGNESVLRLRGGYGNAHTVEVGATGAALVVSAQPPLEPGIAIETSLDGVTWELVRHVVVPSRPKLILDNLERVTGVDFPDLPTSVLYDGRVVVRFELEDSGREFRFLRIRQPMSATGGLSGYLDGSELSLNVSHAGPAGPLPPTAQRAEYDCGSHLLDAVFADHPCVFGSTAAYFDAPSFTHTYWLGRPSHVAALAGSATLHPYRAIAAAQQTEAVITVVVETSRDGRNDWVSAGEFAAAYGVPAPFRLDGLDAEAQFVRLRTEPHRLWSSGGTHHWAGFVAQSTLEVEGTVVPHARGDGPHSDFAWRLAEAAVAPPNVP